MKLQDGSGTDVMAFCVFLQGEAQLEDPRRVPRETFVVYQGGRTLLVSVRSQFG